ncbi:MAG: PRC-barrel domain-containing protein [Armatimonadetes bacterium]|nr:PRC-barrel domain-containing protein [Armatimonadota bacterium]
MKFSNELVALPIISISEGVELGRVKGMITNPGHRTVQFLVVDNGQWYAAAKLVPYERVVGVSQWAVTVENSNSVINVEESPRAMELIKEEVKITNTPVISRKGRYVGKINDFQLDEETGRITACLIRPEEGEDYLLPVEQVITFAREIVVVKEEQAEASPQNPPAPGTKPEEGKATGGDNAIPSAPDPGAKEELEEQQRRLLLGRRAGRDIKDIYGNVLIAAGTVITEEILQKAKNTGKFLELSLNTIE